MTLNPFVCSTTKKATLFIIDHALYVPMSEPVLQSLKEEKIQIKKVLIKFLAINFTKMSLKTRQESKSSSASDNEEQQDNSTIRCPCENNTDHGLMIQCETCLVWQHSLCVGIREDRSVPPHYYCELCLPRNFNCICKQVVFKTK